MKTLNKLLIALLLLNLLDAATTFAGLSFGANEVNTLWGPISQTTLFFKIFVVSFLCVVLYAANFYALKEKAEAARKFIFFVACALNIIFIAVVANNVCVVLAQGLST